MKFTAEIQHNEGTFRRLAQTQYNAYCIPTKLMMLALCLVCLYCGVTEVAGGFSLILLFIGCWTAISMQLPAKRNAEKMIELAHGDFPHTEYQFLSEHIRITGGGEIVELSYTEIYELLEDREYIYLFLDKVSGYMVPKVSVRPENVADFCLFMEEKTGKRRNPVKGLLSLNLRSVLRRQKK